MSKASSTKYLDELMLDGKGLVTRDVLADTKGYCGLFAFILSICSLEHVTDEQKVKLINNVLDSAMKFMTRKYEANLTLYNRQASENLEAGKIFKTLSEMPAQMREDFEMGIEEARHFLRMEAKDILKILKIDLDI